MTARLCLLNYNSLLCDDITLPQRPQRALLAPYYTYGCKDKEEESSASAIESSTTKTQTKVEEQKNQSVNGIVVTSTEWREKQCTNYKKRAINKFKTSSRKGKYNKYPINNESSNDINNKMMLSLSSRDWLNSIPHVVIGRHSLLPPAYRITFPFISRTHIKIVHVGTNKLHHYFTNGYKRINCERYENSLCSVTKETTDLHTSPEEFTQPYYLLINYSDNMLYVNDNAIVKHTSIVLTEGDIISFLENACFTSNDCFKKFNVIVGNDKVSANNNDSEDEKAHNELNTANGIKMKVEQTDDVDNIKLENSSTLATNVTDVKVEPVYIDVDSDMDSVVSIDHNDVKQQSTQLQKITHSNQRLHITLSAKILLDWIDEHVMSISKTLQGTSLPHVEVKTETKVKTEILPESNINLINILMKILQFESTQMSASVESLHISPIQSILGVNQEAVLALLEVLRKQVQLVESMTPIEKEYEVKKLNNRLYGLLSSEGDTRKAHTLSSLLRYMQLGDSNSDVWCNTTELVKNTNGNYDSRVQEQNHKKEMCEGFASLFTLLPAQLPVFVFTCKQCSTTVQKVGDSNNNNRSNKEHIINKEELDNSNKEHGSKTIYYSGNALNYIYNKLHIDRHNGTEDEFSSVAANPFTPLSISHEQSLQLPCADYIYKTSTLTPEECCSNNHQHIHAKNRNNKSTLSPYHYYYYYEEESELQQKEKMEKTNVMLSNQLIQKSEFATCRHSAANKSYAVSETREGRSKYARHAYAHRTARNVEHLTESCNYIDDKIANNNDNNKESGYIIRNDDDDISNDDINKENDDAQKSMIEEFWKDETTNALFRPKRRRRRRIREA